MPRSSSDGETKLAREKRKLRRTWAAADETGQEELLVVEGRNWFEMVVECVVVVAPGRWVGPGNNSACEDGLGAAEALDAGKTVTQAVLVIERCVRSLSGHLEQRDLQRLCLNMTEVADWMTKQSHLETKISKMESGKMAKKYFRYVTH